MDQDDLLEKKKNEILGILLIVFAIISAVSLFSSTAGIVGQKLAELYLLILGMGSYLVPLFLLIWGLTLIRLKGLSFNTRLSGFMLTYLMILSLVHLYLFPQYPLDIKGQGGGKLGGSFVWLLLQLFGYFGTYVILIAFFLIGILLWTNIPLLSILKKGKEFPFSVFQRIFNLKKEDITEGTEGIEEDIIEKDIKVIFEEKEEEEKETEVKIKRNDLPDVDNYRLPGLNLLKDSSFTRKKPDNKSQIIEETLQSFGVQTRVIKVSHGPTITRYELQPATGVKVSRIVSLADDLALALAAPDVRIEAPIPGKAAVGVEVPHCHNILVRLRDILSSKEFQKSDSKLTLALGMGIDGQPIVADLTQMPHLLVAGATGAGKSICINTIIASILYKATPDEVRLILIDPKKVELSHYQGLPHLFAPVVTDPQKAASVLNLVREEMEKRYEIFSSTGSRGITPYNMKVDQEEKLPYIVVIIDELSDLMMVSASGVEDNICRLAQMARAAGIHLVIATQRPSVDVITGLIKANIPSRISFAVSSQTDSRTILDIGGAEKLMGKGDMLFAPVGIQKPQRIQGAFIDNDEVNMLVDYVKNQANPDYKVNLEEIEDIEFELNNESDEFYEEAVKLVVKYSASISMLQRRLHVGHSRAARLIDLMEADGIVGPYVGSKPREVLISEDELDNFLSKNIDED